MYNLLKPGGDIFFLILTKQGTYEAFKEMSIKSKKWSNYMMDAQNYVSPYHDMEHPDEYLEKLLTKTGFNVKICKTYRSSFTYNEPINFKSKFN